MASGGNFKVLQLQGIRSSDPNQQDAVGPTPRSGHRAALDEQGNMLVLGGYSPTNEDNDYPIYLQLWRLNLLRGTWTLLQTRGHMPRTLASHSMLAYHHLLFVFGGTGVPFGTTASNRLHVLDLRTLVWREVPCSGDDVPRLYGQSMFLHADSLYVYGGTTGYEFQRELYRLDLKTFTWTHLGCDGTQTLHEGRYRQEVAIYDNKMYLLGGGADGMFNISYDFKELPMFDLAEERWTSVRTKPSASATAGSQRVAGYPQARRSHACVQFKKHVYMCGGYDGTRMFSYTWSLHLQQLQWTRLVHRMPVPAFFHTAALTPEGRMVVYGGVTKPGSQVRTSAVSELWLEVPPLLRLVVSSLLKQFPHLHRLDCQTLLKLGVPVRLVQQLKEGGCERLRKQGGWTPPFDLSC